jgi:hypothetical protein
VRVDVTLHRVAEPSRGRARLRAVRPHRGQGI